MTYFKDRRQPKMHRSVPVSPVFLGDYLPLSVFMLSMQGDQAIVNPKANQSWIFIGRTDAESETPILWPPDVKNWFLGKDPGAGKDWGQEEKGTAEDEMVGWHHWLKGHEFEQASGVGDGQGSLACCSPWGCKESDMTEQLNRIVSKVRNDPSGEVGLK